MSGIDCPPRFDFTVSDFPSLESAAKEIDARPYSRTRYQQHYQEKVADLSTAVEAGAIRNASFDHCKHVFGTLFGVAWSNSYQSLYESNRNEWTEHTRKTLGFLRIGSFSDLATAHNKLNKLKQTGAHVDALRAFLAEVDPLLQAADYLKPRTLKGREPKAKAAPANPNKDVKTCPCCFRTIAVRNGKMVHHGYERPGDGSQTSSCWGISFPPLEISMEGLDSLIAHLQQKVKSYTEVLKKLPDADKITLHRGGRTFDTFLPTDTKWAWALERKKAEYDGHIQQVRQDLSVCKREHKRWTKWHADQVQTLPEQTDGE